MVLADWQNIISHDVHVVKWSWLNGRTSVLMMFMLLKCSGFVRECIILLTHKTSKLLGLGHVTAL